MSWRYTTRLNIAFLALAAVLVVRFKPPVAPGCCA